jgi:glycosyltransferase involved in cell wall biosynthesis
MPKVSVIIPLYQTERYISQALASVLTQTETDFEVIVVDDGSWDCGPAIANATGDPRVRVITQANRGLAGARNTGIREARAPILAFLDADDIWHPDKLAAHLAHLNSNSEVGVSFSASRLIDDNGQPIGLIQRPTSPTFSAPEIFCRNPVGNGSAPVIRRATLDDIAFTDAKSGRSCWFDESFRQSEDVECWTRIAATTQWQFGFIDKCLTDYRVNSAGLSANTVKQMETWERFRAKVASYAPTLEANYGNRAKAFQLRYLARRAIRADSSQSQTKSQALPMMLEAICLYPRLITQEPSRTITTLVASVAQQAVSPAVFERCSRWAIDRVTSVPGLRL